MIHPNWQKYISLYIVVPWAIVLEMKEVWKARNPGEAVPSDAVYGAKRELHLFPKVTVGGNDYALLWVLWKDDQADFKHFLTKLFAKWPTLNDPQYLAGAFWTATGIPWGMSLNPDFVEGVDPESARYIGTPHVAFNAQMWRAVPKVKSYDNDGVETGERDWDAATDRRLPQGKIMSGQRGERWDILSAA